VPPLTFVTGSADQTRALGAEIGRLLRPGDVVLLHGDLGAGKTTLAQGIAQGLGVREQIQSPTFTLVAEHEGQTNSREPISLYHLDLYRLAGEEDLDSFGWEQYLAPVDGVSVVEWPERAGSWLPQEFLLVRLEPAGADVRRVSVKATPPNGRMIELIADLRDATSGVTTADGTGRIRPVAEPGRTYP
jgi:tRNA threonylcarbamoyladenosine biosynthesis protein TsaE